MPSFIRVFLGIAVLLLGARIAIAQPDSLWSVSFGGEDSLFMHYCGALLETSDHGFIVAGFNLDNRDQSFSSLMKLNNRGEILWRSDTLHRNMPQYAEAVVELSGGGFAATGGYVSSSGFWVDFFDRVGRRWGGWEVVEQGEGRALVETSDGGLLAVGGDNQVVRFDNEHNISWINNYYPGALPRLIAVFRAQSEEAFYLQATGYETAYLLKIDSTGEEVFRREDRCFGGSMFQMEDGGFLCLYVRNPINEADSLEVGMTWLSAEAEVIADDVVYLPNGVRGCLPQPDGSLVHYGRVEPPEFIEKTYVTRLDANHRQVNRREFYFPAPREAIQTSDGGFLFGVTDYQLYAISLLRLSPDGLFAPTRNPSPSSSYLLLTAYPNPFNCSTTVSYMLTLPGWSAVDVVDINGRVMTRLFEGWMSAGLHRVVWDGAGIPSGRYFVRLETTAGKRMATGVEVVR